MFFYANLKNRQLSIDGYRYADAALTRLDALIHAYRSNADVTLATRVEWENIREYRELMEALRPSCSPIVAS